MSEPLNINPEDLTLDEVEEVESIIGGDIGLAFSEGKPKAKAIKAVVFVTLRRTNPEITLEEVGQMKLSALVLGEG